VRFVPFIPLLVCALPAAAQLPAAAPTPPTYAAHVRPFLKTYCATCHSAKLKQAELNLEPYLDESKALAEHELWEKVIRKVRSGEMPPKPLPQPKPEARAAALAWFESRLAAQDKARKVDPGRVTARRLNRAEYNNTIRDLIGLDLRPADEFPIDDSGYGFDNNADVLTLSPVLMERYLATADRVVRALLPREAPKRPTMDRYEPEKSAKPEKPSVALLDEAFAARHTFPAEAGYEIRINVKLREGQTKNPYTLALLIDGDVVERFPLPAGIATRHFDAKVHIRGGLREVAAGFLAPEGVSGNSEFYFDNIEIRGPYNALPPEPGEQYRKVFLCTDDNAACANRILSAFARRAWRRPVTAAEVTRLVTFYTRAREAGDDFNHAIALALKATLVSPNFLYRIEQHPNPTDPTIAVRVSDLELASRLSYFLWSSMPDEELLSLAERNELRKPGVLEAQLKRMSADPRAQAFAENFAGQWLEVRNVDALRPDPKTFPTFDRALREAMYRETILFFNEVVRDNRPVTDFIDGKFTYLNERLARHYGIPGIKGKEFQRIELDGVQRSGVLTQASILAVTSYPTRTSPVQRGLWVLENFLASPPPPPPPNVQLLNEAEIGKNMSLREQMKRHRTDPACAVCHERMDNLGFGLENYNAVGAWRDNDSGFAIDAAGELPGNRTFSSPAGLKQVLLGEKDTFTLALTEKLMTYALGRGMEHYDKPELRRIAKAVALNEYRMGSMMKEIVESPAFQMRRGDGGRKHGNP